MHETKELTLTDEVIARFGKTPDPRLKVLVESLVRHLHAFVRDVEPSFDEWMMAIQYLTRTGQICSDTRQEFILLSDVLGVSMLVDALNHRQRQGATESTVLGPFYVEDPPLRANGDHLEDQTTPGTRLFVDATISDPTGRALAGAIVDVWQSDSEGFYDVQRLELDHAVLRGRFVADDQGRVHFWSITPTFYPIPYDGPVGELLKATERHPYRPAHLHFMIAAEGYERLVTHIFVSGDPYLDSDAVFGVKASLIHAFPVQMPGAAPDHTVVDRAWRRLTYAFGLKPATKG